MVRFCCTSTTQVTARAMQTTAHRDVGYGARTIPDGRLSDRSKRDGMEGVLHRDRMALCSLRKAHAKDGLVAAARDLKDKRFFLRLRAQSMNRCAFSAR